MVRLVALMRLRIQARILVQQALALFRRHWNALQFLARAAQLRDPFFPLRAKLLLEFLAQPLRERGAQPSGGNCDLQIRLGALRQENRSRTAAAHPRRCKARLGCEPRHRFHRAKRANPSRQSPGIRPQNRPAGIRALPIRCAPREPTRGRAASPLARRRGPMRPLQAGFRSWPRRRYRRRLPGLAARQALRTWETNS